MQRKQGTLTVSDVLKEDDYGRSIATKWYNWKTARRVKEREWQEVRNYLYATDTSTTTNKSLPWRNTTTTPKLAQIKDNLLANYKFALFPKRNWLQWMGGDEESIDKRQAVEEFMQYVVSQPHFENTLEELLNDYIEYGNAFAIPIWIDESYETSLGLKSGYVGPAASRISPENIVFDPTAPSFIKTPKIVRSFLTFGDFASTLLQQTFEDENEQEKAREILDYMKNVRQVSYLNDIEGFDESYQVDGFGSFREYLSSGVVEILTFYGDIYNEATGEFLKNKKITVVDRHKVIKIEDNPTSYPYPPIFHVGWRKRRDNLWAMGPLDNLVGLQYRIDHLENMKADAMDLTVFPPLFVKGIVEDFKWAPMSIIRSSDPSADVRPLGPDTSVINVNLEIQRLLDLMEEMAGAPKEAMGFRTPGEKTAYEVQRLENAASRIFQAKIIQFEKHLLEPLLNSMLELAWRNYGDSIQYYTRNDETKVEEIKRLAKEDIMGLGRLYPMAARHFAQQANLIQNITNLKASGIYDEIRHHISTEKLAALIEDALGLENYKIVNPYVAIVEQKKLQEEAAMAEEDLMTTVMTPSGLTEEDSDFPMDQQVMMELMNEENTEETPVS